MSSMQILAWIAGAMTIIVAMVLIRFNYLKELNSTIYLEEKKKIFRSHTTDIMILTIMFIIYILSIKAFI